MVNTPIWNGLTVQLFRARLDGSSPPALVDTESSNVTALDEIRFSPDGAWASYRLKYAYSWYYRWAEPYLVPMDGSLAPRRLFTSSSLEEVASAVEFTPDGSRVVFSVSYPKGYELYSETLLGNGVTIGGTESDAVMRLSPDGRTLYFGGGREVFKARVDGSSPVTQLSLLPAGYRLRTLDISPDGTRLLFMAANTGLLGAASGLWQLSSVATAGGPTELLAAPPVLDLNGVRGLKIAPDSERVVYEARASAAGVFELFLDRPDGTFYPLVLNAPLPGSGTVVRSELIGSRWAVYLASQETAGVLELYRVPLEWPHLEPGRAPAGPPIPF